MNKQLLFTLYRIWSGSYKEGEMRKFIKRYIKRVIRKCKVVEKDGNLYITRGKSDTYPCVVAHLDQVQSKYPADYKVFEHDGIVHAFSLEEKCLCGLGADDKNGIFVALECLKKYDNIKVAFFYGEEVGCRGSSCADMDFFSDVRFVLECDRKNGYDLISDISGVTASKDFLADCEYEKFGYSETNGLMTDIEALCEKGIGVSCVNISCGYYNPHTDEEFTVLHELENCFNFVCHIIETCTKVYLYEYDCFYNDINITTALYAVEVDFKWYGFSPFSTIVEMLGDPFPENELKDAYEKVCKKYNHEPDWTTFD